MYIRMTFFKLTLIGAAIKKDVDMQLGVHFDPQTTNSKEGGAQAILEALTSYLERAREPGVPPGVPPGVHKKRHHKQAILHTY
jgi:hypothetical protein